MDIRIKQRLLPDERMGSLRGMMTDNIRTLLLQNRMNFTCADIDLIEASACIQGMARSVYKTIDDEHIMTSLQIGFGEMCSNETCSPCDSYFHGHSLSLLFVEPVYYCYAGSNLPLLL